MSYQDFLRARHNAGNFGDKPGPALADRLGLATSGQAGSHIDVSVNGKVVNSLQRATSDGGWILTYEDITERHLAEAKIAFVARHDGLTGLANRTLFQETLEAALETGEPVAVFCLDLDSFKRINDSLGHAAGDEVLLAVAKRLQNSVREHDLVARLGGDEFAIIQTGNDWPDAAHALASRIVDAAIRPIEVFGHNLIITTCIGISRATADCPNSKSLLKQADIALYTAKADGCGGYRFFDPAMVARQRELEAELAEAPDQHIAPDCLSPPSLTARKLQLFESVN